MRTRYPWRVTCIAILMGALAVACAPSAAPSPTAAPAKPAATAAPAAKAAPAATAAPKEAAPAAKPAAKPVTLRAISSWERPIGYSQPHLQLIERINKKTNGELQISFAGPEVVPPFEAMTAVSKGVYDIAHTVPSYYVTNLPEATALQGMVGSCQKYREAGVFDLFDQLHRQKTNTTFLGCLGGGSGFIFLTKDPVESLDFFKGKKIRGDQLRVPIIEALGAAAVVIPPAEVYTALERKIVDGIAWPENGIVERKFEEVVKYMIRPPWLEAKLDYVMNVDAFNKLPPHLQKALQESVREMEDEADKYLIKQMDDEHAELKKKGMQFITLSPAEGQKLVKLVMDVFWGRVEKDSPEWGPKLRAAVAKVKV